MVLFAVCRISNLQGVFLHSSALFYSGWDGLSSKSWWSAAALMWSPWWRFVCDPVTTSHGPKRTETVGCAIEVHPGLTSCCWLYPARQTPASLITGGRLTFWSAASILDGLRTWKMWAAQGLLHCRSAGLETHYTCTRVEKELHPPDTETAEGAVPNDL